MPEESGTDPALKERSRKINDLVADVAARRLAGEQLTDGQVIEAHPEFMPELAERLRSLARVEAGREDAEAPAATESVLMDAAGRLPPDAPARDSIPGYDLLGELHRGGQGVVYRAIQQSTKRRVAIKVMKEGPFAGPADRARFEREVQLLGALDHPNIATIHDSGSAAGCPYFVMNHISGRPLDEYVQNLKTAKCKTSKTRKNQDAIIDELLRLFVKVCHAVNAAHLRGIIHRDLKPSNIRVDDKGEPYILDFGLARSAAESEAWTMTGQFLGSLPWASPEQAEGDPAKIDLRTDVYSLGVNLYYVLTGTFPYNVIGNMRDVIDNIMRTEPVRPGSIEPWIDDEIETIVLKCLSKERDRRYQTAGELARDIEHYLEGEPIEAKRASTLYLLRKQMRRYRVRLVVAAGFLLMIVLSSVVAWTLYLRSQNNLWESYLAQARLNRTSGRAGQGVQTLEILAKAAAIRPSLELRNEAIAAMALPDLTVVKQWTARFDGHDELRFAEDLHRFCTFDRLGDVSVRRVSDGAELLHLAAHGTDTCVWPQFSPDGMLLVRAGKSGYEVWDITTATRILELSTPPIPFAEASFSPDGRELAVGSREGIVIHDLVSGARRLLPYIGAVHPRLWFHPKLPIIATSSHRDKDVLIRRSDNGKLICSLSHPENVWFADWDANGTRLATACEDLHVRVWNTNTGEVLLNLTGHLGNPAYVRFDASGNTLMSSGWDGLTHFWDTRTGRNLFTVHGEKLGRRFSRSGSLLGMSETEDSRRDAVVVKFREGLLNILVGSQGSKQQRKATRGLVLACDGRLAADAALDGLRLWDLHRGVELAYLDIGLTEAVLYPSSKDQLITSGPGGVYCWPLTLEDDTVRLGPPRELNLPPRAGGSGCAALSADGTRLVVGFDRSRFAILDLALGGEVKVLGDQDELYYLAISPDDSWVATSDWGSTNGGTRIWNAEDGSLVGELPDAMNSRLLFSPDGNWLIASNWAANWFLEVGTWTVRHRLARDGAGVPGTIAFSPDERYLALQDRRTAIQLHDARTLKLLATLQPPDGSHVKGAAFTADASQLVCGTHKSYLLHVWDLRAIRKQLSSMSLDWDLPPYPEPPPEEAPPAPLRIEVDLGDLGAQDLAVP
jgi:serine/threonine protein kinase/WD40 repeat protein